MTRPYSPAFRQKMLERLTGKDAVSAQQLSVETGVRQQNLSRWLQEARSLPAVGADDAKSRQWTVQQKARVLGEASGLSGNQLHAYLDREGVRLVDFERWRVALQEDGRDSTAVTRRIRQLERELARKEKALAEAAALLVLKKNDRAGGAGRGRRHRRAERQLILTAISRARASGARLKQACRVVGISCRTLQRWQENPEADDRRYGPHRRPPNALRPSEEAQILTVMVSARFAHLFPKQLNRLFVYAAGSGRLRAAAGDPSSPVTNGSNRRIGNRELRLQASETDPQLAPTIFRSTASSFADSGRMAAQDLKLPPNDRYAHFPGPVRRR
jgi:transposase